MQSQRKLRVGVIGAGRWGTVHASVYSGLPQVELVALADPSESTLQNAAKMVSQPVATYGDFHELLADPTVDAVSITVPDHLHTDVILAAVASDKHVLVEKPLTLTVEDAKACVAAMHSRGKTYMVNFSLRWMTPFYRAKQLIEQGKIGQPRYCLFEQSNTPEVPLNMLKWASRSNVIWFLGVHSIDMVEWLFSARIQRVSSRAGKGVLAAKGVETHDYFISTCELSDGSTAVIENSWILPEAHPGISTCRCRIVGTEGTLVVDALSTESLSYFDRVEHMASNMFGLNEVDGRLVGSPAASIEHFVRSVLSGTPPIVTMDDGLSTVLVATAILEAASSGSAVTVNRD